MAWHGVPAGRETAGSRGAGNQRPCVHDITRTLRPSVPTAGWGHIVEHWVGIWRRYWVGAWWSILDGNMAEGIGWQYGMVEEHCQTKLTIILFDNNVWIWE